MILYITFCFEDLVSSADLLQFKRFLKSLIIVSTSDTKPRIKQIDKKLNIIVTPLDAWIIFYWWKTQNFINLNYKTTDVF